MAASLCKTGKQGRERARYSLVLVRGGPAWSEHLRRQLEPTNKQVGANILKKK